MVTNTGNYVLSQADPLSHGNTTVSIIHMLKLEELIFISSSIILGNGLNRSIIKKIDTLFSMILLQSLSDSFECRSFKFCTPTLVDCWSYFLDASFRKS